MKRIGFALAAGIGGFLFVTTAAAQPPIAVTPSGPVVVAPAPVVASGPVIATGNVMTTAPARRGLFGRLRSR